MSLSDMNFINNMEIEKTSLFCNTCNEWLSTPVYLCVDEMNYCEPCSQKLSLHSIRNLALENILENLLYRCHYCWEFVAKFAEVETHHKNCKDFPIIINCCNKDMPLTFIQSHLIEEHSMRMYAMNGNSVTLKLENIMETAVFWEVFWNENRFIIRTIQSVNSVQVNICTQDIGNGMCFSVLCGDLNVKGTIVDYSTLFNKSVEISDEVTANLEVENTKDLKLKILFGEVNMT